VQRDLKDGPKVSIDRILAGKARIGVPKEFEQTAATLADNAVSSGRRDEAQGLVALPHARCPDPLSERLTLLWHNHFATSNEKISNLAAMRRQNDLFRQHARASFPELLKAVVYDSAMLIWLDAPSNKKGAPNENLARELMELFTMGVGNYTEKDVKESARALTGWTVDKDKFRESNTGERPHTLAPESGLSSGPTTVPASVCPGSSAISQESDFGFPSEALITTAAL
jgi:uncharacterized protein (DUF1800 family)